MACDGSSKQFLEKATVLGTDVKSASAQLSPQAGGWQVSLKFTSKGQDRWTAMTRKSVGKRMAAVLDNTVISSPTIEEIMTGDAQITGSFSPKEAKDLASKLNYGALPLSFAQQNLQSITPTLGIESLKAGLLAGGIGLGAGHRLLAALLPGARAGHDRQPGGLRRDHLRRRDPARPGDRLHPDPRRRRRIHRGGGYHR